METAVDRHRTLTILLLVAWVALHFLVWELF